MPRTLTIDPVTRVEGHAKITIELDDAGHVADARLHVDEFRGFEKFCEGRLLWEMPGITSRICGICPASHQIASAKAGDDILAIGIPETAEKLRRVLVLAQWVQSHALSFFHLSAPDLLFGFDAPPESRNLFALIAKEPELARRGIRLRKFGQEIVEVLGGRRIHTPWAVPGGVREPLEAAQRDRLLAWIPEARETSLLALDVLKTALARHAHEVPAFGSFLSLHVGLVADDGAFEYYGGRLRVKDGDGNTVAERIDPRDYRTIVGERTESWSYLKFPYYKPLGYPKGIYRVGPLARLNVCDYMDTPLAEAERQVFKRLAGSAGAVNNSFHYHHARLVETLFAVEMIERLLRDPAILGTHVRAKAMINRTHGVGACEAPRGTLFHDYTVDEDGVLRAIDLVIATGQNHLAMNRTVRQLALHHLDGVEITEGLLNRIEAGIRCFDPCLSCSTHAMGRMPLAVEVLGPGGELLASRVR